MYVVTNQGDPDKEEVSGSESEDSQFEELADMSFELAIIKCQK